VNFGGMALNRIRLVTFDLLSSSARKVGVLLDKQVVDLEGVGCHDMRSFLNGGRSSIEYAVKMVASGQNRISLSDVKLRAPIYNPEKVVCVGLNYRNHAIESGMAIPVEPVLFSKFASAIIGDKDKVEKPKETEQLDYEVELVIVIGKEGRNIQEKEAIQHVAGYTVGNDVSARDWQLKKGAGQWMVGKTWDTFAPIGPSILVNPLLLSSSDSFNPNQLGIRLFLNEKKMQDSNTKEFIFPVESVISYISKIVTLKPGDLIFTGTPSGVGFGRKPPVFVNVGDKMRCEIDEIGVIENEVIAPLL